MNQDVYRSTTEQDERRWSALDPSSRHPLSAFCNEEHAVEQEAAQRSSDYQLSEELIFIKDSCNVEINSTDVKAALSLQSALQAAIAVIISISIADSERAESITQELMQSSRITQITRQKTIVENSRDVDIRTTDAQVATNIQLLLQLLLALVVELEIL
jgi:spore coat protein X